MQLENEFAGTAVVLINYYYVQVQCAVLPPSTTSSSSILKLDPVPAKFPSRRRQSLLQLKSDTEVAENKQ